MEPFAPKRKRTVMGYTRGSHPTLDGWMDECRSGESVS